MKSIHITTSGEIVWDYDATTLKEKQRAVDGYIEIVNTPIRDTTIYVNEEGLLHKLPYNSCISSMINHSIVGNVLIETSNTRVINYLKNYWPLLNNPKTKKS